MKRPAITVAMSVYNGERFLAEAIDSVLAQTFTDFEFLIVDDGSTDSSPEMIRAYAERDARIRPIIRENRGLIASLNQMIDDARAPIIARMDADDICHPSRLALQMQFLADHPDYGVVGGWVDDIDEYGEIIPCDESDHPETHEEFLKAIPIMAPLLCHPLATFRREAVEVVGGYHAAFKHCEDLDLWLRLASVTKLGNVPHKLLKYRRYDGQVSRKHATEQMVNAHASRLAFAERQAGRTDPTATLDALPKVGGFDELFGRPGVDRYIRAQVTPIMIYSPASLTDGGFEIVLDHVRSGGQRDGMWRTVLRLLRFGEPRRAMRLAATLAGSQ